MPVGTPTDYVDIGSVQAVMWCFTGEYTQHPDSSVAIITGSDWVVDGHHMEVEQKVFVVHSGILDGIYEIIGLPSPVSQYAYLKPVVVTDGNVRFVVSEGGEYGGSSWVRYESTYLRIFSSDPDTESQQLLSEIKSTLSGISCNNLAGLGKLSDYVGILDIHRQIKCQKRRIQLDLLTKTSNLQNTNRTLTDIITEIQDSKEPNDNALVRTLHDFVIEIQKTHSNLRAIKTGLPQYPQSGILSLLKDSSLAYDNLVPDTDRAERCRTAEFKIQVDLNLLFAGIDVLSDTSVSQYHEIISIFKCSWATELVGTATTFYQGVEFFLMGLWETKEYEQTTCPVVEKALLHWLQHGDFADNCFILDELEGIVHQLRACRKYSECHGNSVRLCKNESMGCYINVTTTKKEVIQIQLYLTQI